MIKARALAGGRKSLSLWKGQGGGTALERTVTVTRGPPAGALLAFWGRQRALHCVCVCVCVCVMHQESACYPCVGAMLIVSVQRDSTRSAPEHKNPPLSSGPGRVQVCTMGARKPGPWSHIRGSSSLPSGTSPTAGSSRCLWRLTVPCPVPCGREPRDHFVLSLPLETSRPVVSGDGATDRMLRTDLQ